MLKYTDCFKVMYHLQISTLPEFFCVQTHVYETQDIKLKIYSVYSEMFIIIENIYHKLFV